MVPGLPVVLSRLTRRLSGTADTMPADERLEKYHAKRNLATSGEPAAGTGAGASRFVIQRHEASSTHFDFRLEVDDVLASWAVPKGPSTDPREKRLARQTEDHPVDYLDFEGAIPHGEYGAGTVIVWDTGTYTNLTQRSGSDVPVAQAINGGHLKVWLDGAKLTGAYTLTRMRDRGDGADWLLIKVDDEGADRRRKPTRTQPESVLSGQTNADLEAGDDQ